MMDTEKKSSIMGEENLQKSELSQDVDMSNENLDLSDLEEVSGGVDDKDAAEDLKGNGCGSCFGMCG